MFRGPVNAGELRDRCVFEELVETPDGAGGLTATWSEVHRCSGKLETTGAPAEREVAGIDRAVIEAVVTIRDLTAARTITAACRVTIADQVWNVRGRWPLDQVPGFLRFAVSTGVAP